MKKMMSVILVMATLCLMLFSVSCGGEKVTVLRSFIGGTVEDGDSESSVGAPCGTRAVLNLMSDGTAEIYYGKMNDQTPHTTAQWKGTYTLGENEEFDETITITLDTGKIADNAVIIDSVFEATLPEGGNMKLYETAPVSMDGDLYVGYLSKASGMGAMVYAYALTMREDGTFDVSIMQMATVMHVWDKSSGTYTVNMTDVTFTYDVMDGEGAVAEAGYVSEGSLFRDNSLYVGFNIAQTAMRASNAGFIRVK